MVRRGRGAVNRKSRTRAAPEGLPPGFRAIITYSIIVGICYAFSLFIGLYNPELLSLSPGTSVIWFDAVMVIVLVLMIFGIHRQKPWAYPLLMLWFLSSILLSLASVFLIARDMLPTMR